MDLKEFSQNFFDGIDISVEMNGSSYEEEVASSIIDYIVDSGEVNAPEICTYNAKQSRLSAYDYNDEAETLDLFYLVKAENRCGKVNKGKIQQGINFVTRFYNEALDGTILKSERFNDEIEEVASLIISSKGNITSVRFFILCDGIGDNDAIPASTEQSDGLVFEYNLWDIHRVYQQDRIKGGKDKIEIDFPANYDIEVPCIKMNENNPDVDAYLAIMPGITLAKIYREYKQSLLERNVRTFLQFKSKVNRGIRDTLRDNPQMFFSYNNGISTTSSEIETKYIDGALYVTRLYDWQIVNGGQTTASIASVYDEKNVDLTKVFVPMKISVIKDKEKLDEIIPQISANANSQTAIKNSDFSANDPYLVSLENFSRSVWVPNGNKKCTFKWYFERTRGQYLDELSHLSGFNEKEFKTSNPKSNKFTKTDIAKYEMSWMMQPYEVCKGAEKNYQAFAKYVKERKVQATESYYKHLVAKAILFKEIDKMVRLKNLGGYKSNMITYILAALSLKSNSLLDLETIWNEQSLRPNLIQYIDDLIPLIWNSITNPPKQGMNVNEWTKKVDCWNTIKLQLSKVSALDDNLRMTTDVSEGNVLNNSQKELIADMESISVNKWFALSKWAKEHDELTPMDRKAAYNFGMMRSRNKLFSLKQAIYAKRIYSRAVEKGFIME